MFIQGVSVVLVVTYSVSQYRCEMVNNIIVFSSRVALDCPWSDIKWFLHLLSTCCCFITHSFHCSGIIMIILGLC